MDYVEYVEKNRSKFKNYDWLHQFDRDTDGIRMTPIKFMGMKMKYGMDEVVDGILGERIMRQLMKTPLLKDKLDPSVFSRELTADERNDIQNYYAWATFDNLASRAQEGRNEIIPRQEYEFIAFTWIFLRISEYIKLAVLKLGWEEIVRRQFNTRREIGGNCDQIGMGAWITIAEPTFGFISLNALGMIDNDDPAIIEKKKWIMNMGLLRSYVSTGADGLINGARRRYVFDKEPEVVDYVMDRVKAVDAKKIDKFKKFFAAAQLLGFCTAYDCRANLGENGPFIVEDGKPMLLRTTIVNDPIYSWNENSERRGLPFSFVFACVFDPDKIKLQEFRVIDIATTFTHPANFIDALEKVAIFRRWEPEGTQPLPMEKLEEVDWSEVDDLTNKCNECIIDWYAEVAKMPRRQKIMNGVYVYEFIASTIGAAFLRPLGLWDYVNQNLDFWELPPMTSDAYYKAGDKIVKEFVPMQIFTGAGWTDFTDKAAPTSKYREYLKWARKERGWVSDLSGMQPIPDDLKAHVDEDGILQVPMQTQYDPKWLSKK